MFQYILAALCALCGVYIIYIETLIPHCGLSLFLFSFLLSCIDELDDKAQLPLRSKNLICRCVLCGLSCAFNAYIVHVTNFTWLPLKSVLYKLGF